MTRAPAIARWFVHMPKTAGTTWRAALMTTPAADIGDPRHIPASAVPARARASFRVFGCLRAPDAWYVSLWRHAVADQEHHAALGAWTGGDLSLSAALTAWTGGACPEAAQARPFVICPTWGDFEWTPGEGLWSQAIRFWFMGADGWAVDDLVPVEDTDATLRSWGITPRPARNVRAGDAPALDPVQQRVIREADGAMFRAALAHAGQREAA